MRLGSRRYQQRTFKPLALTVLLAFLIAPVQGQENPLLVNYGDEAPSIEGDHDYVQVIYFRIPDNIAEPLYLRVFDADSGGDHDLLYRDADTETRYSLFGGPGAYSETTAQPLPKAEDLTGGILIDAKTYGVSPAHDNQWRTIASFSPSDGEMLDGHYFFKLIVEGAVGNDANVFDVTLSLREQRNLSPPGLQIFTYSPTVRVPSRDRVTEIRFSLPREADEITIHNFDVANATLLLATAFRSIPITASQQDEWRDSTVKIEQDEKNYPAAIIFSGGDEIPNDATFFVTDPASRVLPIALPPYSWKLNHRPTPVVEARPLADCLSVAFDASGSSDEDGDSLHYAWEFGDGGSATGSTVVHRYQQPGAYRARLKVFDASGQAGSGAMETFTVATNRPPKADAGPHRVVAPGQEVTFDGSASSDGDYPIEKYLWNFNDGNRSQGKTVTHAFEKPGRYLVTLRVEDSSSLSCNSNSDSLEVWVNAAPVAEAGEDLAASVGESITLDAQQSYDLDGEIGSFSWDMGDGTQQQGPTIQHVYSEPGDFVVSLTVRDGANVENSVASDIVSISVNAPPVAAAGPDRSTAIGEVIEFDATTSTDQDGQIIAYAWDFGNGAVSDSARVSYAYSQPGEYRVTLTVRDDSDSRSDTGEDSLRVLVNAPPAAEAGDDHFITASEVQFDGTGSWDPDGSIASYLWDFGDDTTSSEPAPLHAYRSPGVYRVRLTVTDDSGTLRNSDTDEAVVIVNAAPIADAGADQIGSPGQRLAFDGTRSVDPDGDIVEYRWDFGDDNSALGPRVSHAYARPGTYTVRLMVGDNTEHETAVDYDQSQVLINSPPVANAGKDVLAAPGDVVNFDAANSFDLDGEIIAYQWDFSDTEEIVEAAQTGRKYEQPGVYAAQLTVTDNSGTRNATSQAQIAIHINHTPKASPGRDLATWDNTITFDASASADADGDALTYIWDFGDGAPLKSGLEVTHTYAEGGTYPVILTVDDGTGLANGKDIATLTVTINQPPVADAGTHQRVCAGDVVIFDGGDSRDPEGGLLKYHWDFGDGASADEVNPTKTYDIGGVYPITLAVQDDSGLPDNTHVDRITVQVDETPLAQAGPDQKVCANTQVRFDGSRSRDFDEVVNRYTWDFGDGAIGGGDRPIHIYSEPGTYRVTLTIEGDQGGECDNTDTDELTVTVFEAPTVQFTRPELAPVGVPVSFDASSSSGGISKIASWRWDFGDGATGEGEQLTHVFENPGKYVVTLAVETEDKTLNCNLVSTQQAIVINAPPTAVAGPDQFVGVNQEVILNGSDSSDEDGAVVSYHWNFGDGETATGVEVRHRYRNSGRFPVVLTVTDDTDLENNSNTAALYVTVNAPPKPVIEVQRHACVNEELTLGGANSTDLDGEIVSYQWNFGDGEKAEGAVVSHRYAAPGRYLVSLAVDDGTAVNNNQSATSIILSVNHPPSAEAGPHRIVCAGSPVTFNGSGSIDWDGQLVRYQWDFGDGAIAEGQEVTHTFEKTGLHRVRLSVTDDSGSICALAEDAAEIFVNSPPIAQAGPDRTTLIGAAHDVVLFDAMQSTDPDGHPLTYSWDFGDGVTETGATVTHAYAKPGQYTVRLRVDDGSGLPCGQSFDELTVEVKSRE